MNNTKNIKILSFLLSLLLLLSTVVLLSAAAEEEVTGSTTTVTLSPDADIYVQKGKTSAFNETKLFVKSDNNGNTARRAYLLFDTAKSNLVNATVTSATLRFFCQYANAGDAQNRKEYKLYATISDNAWSESGTYTFDAPPVTNDVCIATVDLSALPNITSEANGQWFEIDVTDYIAVNLGKQITFSLRNEGVSSNDNHIYVNSKDATSNKPQLVIEATTQSESLKPTYDLYVESNKTSANYYNKDAFIVKSENGSPVRRSYLMFDTSASTVADVSDIGSVTLRLYCTWANTTAGEKENRKQYRLYAFTDYEWPDQTTVTWSAQPSSTTMELVQFIDASAVVANTWVEIDVTEYVTKHWGEKITFSLRNHGPSSSENHLNFSSMENTNGNAPELFICTADHTAKDGAFVSVYTENDTKLSVYSCACGGQWAYDENGVLYRGESVYKVCEQYTLWTAANGSFRTYKTNEVMLAGHAYNANGLCSHCKEYEYIKHSYVNAKAAPTLDKVTGLSAPSYDATNGWISAPDGGVLNMYTGMSTKSESNISPTPFVISFDFSLSAVLEGNAGKTVHWPLLRYRGDTDGTSATQRTLSLLSIGATGAVSADATETNEKIYLVLGADHTFSNGASDAIFYLTKDEWYNIQIAVDPIGRYYYVHVNGEFVGAVKTFSESYTYSEGLCRESFLFGFNGGVNYRYNVGYKLDNIKVIETVPEYIYDLAPTNELIKIDYSTPFLSKAKFGQNSNWTSVRLGTHNNLAATEIVDGYGYFKAEAHTTRRLSASSNVGGKEIAPLANGKYEITVDFAIRANEEGIVYSSASSKSSTIIYLTKYGVSHVKSELVSYTSSGTYKAAGKDLYSISGQPLSAVRTFTDNVPNGTSRLQVVVDEELGLYSIYVDGSPAYFYDDETLIAFVDQPMPLSVSAEIKNQFVDASSITYGDITREIAQAAITNLSANTMHAIDVFAHLLDFAVKEITVTAIPDENVTLVGVQQRVADVSEATQEAFDLRFIFGIDNLFVSEISFLVEAYKNGVYVGTQTVTVAEAYDSIVANNDVLHAYECVEGEYFVAFKIMGIEEIGTAHTYTFLITPTVFHADGAETRHNVAYRVTCDGQGSNITVGVEEITPAV